MLAVLIGLLLSLFFALQNSAVQTRLARQAAKFLSRELKTTITVGKVDIRFFRSVSLEDILIEDQQADTLLFAHEIRARIDTLSLRKRILILDELSFDENRLHLKRDTTNTLNFKFLLDAMGKSKPDSTQAWDIKCSSFSFSDLDAHYVDDFSKQHKHLFFDKLNLDVRNFHSHGDSVLFEIEDLSLHANGNLLLKTLQANVSIRDREINISKCNFESRNSHIENSSLSLELPSEKDSVRNPMELDIHILESRISFLELGQIVPGLQGMDQVVYLSGQIYGNLDDLKGKNIRFNTGDETSGEIDFYINDITHPENMYLFIDVKESQTSFSDLSGIHLPNTAGINYLQFPESFTQAGLLTFKGNFSGFLHDFVTFGTLNSRMGSLTTDLLVIPEKKGAVYYRGNVSSANFQLGRLFREKTLGELTFKGSVDGRYNPDDESVSGVFKGDVRSIEINDYTYNNIKFDGVLVDKMFDGLLSMNDSNLRFNFLGQFDLNKKIPEFDFTLQVDKARPAKLNLFHKFPNAELAFTMSANFSGNSLDNLDGTINVNEGYYSNRNGNLDLKGMSLKNTKNGGTDSLSFHSDFADIDVEGEYHFRDFGTHLQQMIRRFVPSYVFEEKKQASSNSFNFKVNIKDINPLANIFVPGLELDTPFLLYGKIDSDAKNAELEGSIPGIRYNNLLARDIFIGNKVIDNAYTSKFRFGELVFNDRTRLFNFRVDSDVKEDLLTNSISWSNYDELTYSGNIRTETRFSSSDNSDHTHIVIDGKPSDIYIADTLWHISPYTVVIDTSSLTVSGFSINNHEQTIAMEGRMVKGQTDVIGLELSDFELSDLNIYLKKNLEISGRVNGRVGFANLFDQPAVLSDLKIDDFRYRNLLMGDVELLSHWNGTKSEIDSRLRVRRADRLSLDAFGSYTPSTGVMDIDATFDSVSLVVLETFIGEPFSNYHGYGSGTVNLGGTLDKILINGALMGHNAGLTINATQVPYLFNDSVYFRNDTLLFDNILVSDDRGNTGRFNGTIVHTSFSNMIYDLDVTSDRIRALNTTLSDNEVFYGVAMARGRLDINGRGKSVFLNGSVTTLPGTDINISMESESEVERYDFIEFLTQSTEEEPAFYQTRKEEEESKLRIQFTVEATPEARVQLIYNSQIGDVIKAQGEGLLVFEMNPDGEIFLSGNYTPTRGDYLFTLENVINKRFTIEPGGSIIWSGDPYNANIDLKAIYKLKASLYDLMSKYNVSQSQRIQVECIIHLEDELANPTVGFDINFPTAEEAIKDQLIQFFNTEEQMNKQILSLIVMGKFYTPEYLRGTYEAQNSNMLGTTASELFSNQLSNWLSQIDEHWDVGVNYRPGNQVTDDEIELALSTQIFNDRVTLNGNIGNNANQFSTSSSQIVGDFEIDVKLVPSGKIQFKAYTRSNNNLIYETAPYTQGIGLSYTEEFNTVDELFRKFTSLFKKK